MAYIMPIVVAMRDRKLGLWVLIAFLFISFTCALQRSMAYKQELVNNFLSTVPAMCFRRWRTVQTFVEIVFTCRH